MRVPFAAPSRRALHFGAAVLRMTIEAIFLDGGRRCDEGEGIMLMSPLGLTRGVWQGLRCVTRSGV